MRWLDRSAIDVPIALQRYKHGINKWDHVSPADKVEIRAHLIQLQSATLIVCCAYCEGSINPDSQTSRGFIEHFRTRDKYPKLTFDWGNLFLSCSNKNHCGNIKDTSRVGSYSPDDLIKPDEESSEEYVVFSSSGRALVKEGLSSDLHRKATETIRTFNLNDEKLVERRKNVTALYRYKLKEIYEFQDLIESAESGEDKKQWSDAFIEGIEKELLATKNEPYSSTIRDFFMARDCLGEYEN